DVDLARIHAGERKGDREVRPLGCGAAVDCGGDKRHLLLRGPHDAHGADRLGVEDGLFLVGWDGEFGIAPAIDETRDFGLPIDRSRLTPELRKDARMGITIEGGEHDRRGRGRGDDYRERAKPAQYRCVPFAAAGGREIDQIPSRSGRETTRTPYGNRDLYGQRLSPQMRARDAARGRTAHGPRRTTSTPARRNPDKKSDDVPRPRITFPKRVLGTNEEKY